MKNNRLRVWAVVFVVILVAIGSSAHGGNIHSKAAKKFLRKVPTAELPAKAAAYIAQTKVEERFLAFEAIKSLYPNLPIPQPSSSSAQSAPPTVGPPFVPGGPNGYINRNQTAIRQPGGCRCYSRTP
jgi:hypothetical protein